MRQPNPTEVKRVEAIIEDKLKEYVKKYQSDFDPDWLTKLLNNLLKDKDYLEARKLYDDEQWKQDNLWPREISILYNLIELADTYLFGEDRNSGRGFKKYTNLDIIAFQNWPFDANIPAQCYNAPYKKPYVQINLSKMPGYGTSTLKGWTDELLPVLVHEIFHSCQIRHLGTFSIDKEKDLWFWEATAVAVEKQAREYFENATNNF